MYMYDNDAYLCHYGIQGMKWGQHLFGGRAQQRENSRRTKSL